MNLNVKILLVYFLITVLSYTVCLAKDKKENVPTPQPVTSNYDIGVYYFPGWHSKSKSWDDLRGEKWSRSPNKAWPERVPLLGFYPEEKSWVKDWHIKWAVEHGIRFFIYDWYWENGKPNLMHALAAHSKANYRNYIQFSILWANHNPEPKSLDGLRKVVQNWINILFGQPDYYKIDGKPLVVIFSPWQLRENLGKRNIPMVIEMIREMVRKAGYKDIYLVACNNVSDPENIGQLILEGYDAVSTYNYIHVSGPRISTYDSLIEAYDSIWNKNLSTINIFSDVLSGKKSIEETLRETKLINKPTLSKKLDEFRKLVGSKRKFQYLIPVTPGWDDRPWHGETAYIRTGSNPDKFKQMLRRAKDFADKHEKKNIVDKVIIIEAWNEFTEGSYIEPTYEWKFGYLDAIREIFTNAPEKHVDDYPKENK